MTIPPDFQIFQTDHWTIDHRINSALPGYLMLSTRIETEALHQLPQEALAELGGLLARLQYTLGICLNPKRLYMGRYGHSSGYPFHFHFIPIYNWVEDLFWSDKRYRALNDFSAANRETSTDGAELTLFIWREFCERRDPPPIQGPTVAKTIEMLRLAFK
jgi:diadenosine tetraphosphate (Ap4A) HIT family hydrolase